MLRRITITVAGPEILQYLAQLIGCPDFAETDVPTTFALAPIGVALPPISVPIERAQLIVANGKPLVTAKDCITGIIVAAKGILSINADAIALTQIIIAIKMYGFPLKCFQLIAQ